MTWPPRWQAGPDRTRVAFVVALAPAAAVFLATVPSRRGFFDLRVYYGAVHFWLTGGPLYEYVLAPTDYGYTYPPFAALAMLPMMLVSWHTAIAISLLLSAAAAAALLYWLVDPIARRHGWPRWFALAVAGCLVAILEPVRDTFSFGQVNILLLALVFADAGLLARRSRWAGVGIGLAAAVKLVPAIFIAYLLLTGRRTAAAVATSTTLAATALAAVVAPGTSRNFWTETMWDTGRVGLPSYVSNQSLMGALARLHQPQPNRLVWLAIVLATLAIWAYRVRRSHDIVAGFALTGVVGCLVSPVTWVHHLVWLVPALIVTADHGLRDVAGRRRDRRTLGAVGLGYVVLCSSVVWLWRFDSSGLSGFLGSNIYVWVSLALLLGMPMESALWPRRIGLPDQPDAAEQPIAGHPDILDQATAGQQLRDEGVRAAHIERDMRVLRGVAGRD